MGSVVAVRRIIDPEEVVHHRPCVALAVPRLALTHVQDDYTSRPAVWLRRLDREGAAELRTGRGVTTSNSVTVVMLPASR